MEPQEINQPTGNKGSHTLFAIALGSGIGVAAGAAMHDVATWTSIGVAVGLALAAGLDEWRKSTFNRTNSATRPTLQYDPKSEGVIIFELYLPVKHEPVLKLILDEFLDINSLLNSSAFGRFAASVDHLIPREDLARQFTNIIRGYSIYRVEGRFGSDSGSPIDELAVVARIIVRADEESLAKIAKRSDFTFLMFISRRLADETGEEEIWHVVYKNCDLTRWVRQQ